jgi:hypothetical protein
MTLTPNNERELREREAQEAMGQLWWAMLDVARAGVKATDALVKLAIEWRRQPPVESGDDEH